jgi:Big-like domain-containing protein
MCDLTGTARLHSVRSRLLVLLLPLALACDSTAPGQPATLRVLSGNGQIGRIGNTLPAPLIVRVADAGAAPIPGVRVEWSTSGGTLAPVSPVTDRDGHAEATWTLGATPGTFQATAVVTNLDPGVFGATALTALPEMNYNELYRLDVPTYDGSGQVVHPDYATSSASGFRFPAHLAITPYPFGNPGWENPSVFAGDGPLSWLLENGAPNPVATPGTGYLSDPDLVYVAEKPELWMYYRQVTGKNLIHLIRSQDGVHWSSPVEVVAAPNHEIISPTVVQRGPKDWWMWAVNGGAAGCAGAAASVEVRRSEDGQHWSPASAINLVQPGFFPWHIDVEWIATRNEFWAVYNVKIPGGCATPAVFLATSPDGVNWTSRSTPLLAKGSIPAFADVVYRSTFSYDPVSDDIIFWYSGARYDGRAYVWSAAVQRRTRNEVFLPSSTFYYPAPLLVPAPAELEEWP